VQENLGLLIHSEMSEVLKLRDISIITDIPFFIRVAVAPFFCGERTVNLFPAKYWV